MDEKELMKSGWDPTDGDNVSEDACDGLSETDETEYAAGAVVPDEADGQPGKVAGQTGSDKRRKTEEELAAENEARCDEELKSEKFCLTYTLRFKDLAIFNLRYSLLGFNSILFWLVMAIGIAYLALSWTELGGQKRALIICLLVFLIWYVPVRAVINAAKSAAYLRKQSTPTEYHACENGFVIVQDGQRGVLEYRKIRRIRETRSTLYAYVFTNSGFIFPKDLVGERYESLIALLRAKTGK